MILQSFGILRSLAMYYAVPFRLRRMLRFYSQFIQPGDLCFDVGAHVGSRLRVWIRLGARIVAVEPQPNFMRLLRLGYGRQSAITLLETALGSAEGEQVMYISQQTPTVTTLSREWASAVRKANSFANVRWGVSEKVRVTTLDALIAEYGEPVFCKIDLEGYELEVLKGLSRPLRCLSFEYIPATAELAISCLERLDSLGAYQYNYVVGESSSFHLDLWTSADQIADWLTGLPVNGPSGDIYARLK